MSGDKWKKERNRVGLIVEEFPLEKGNSYHWTVRIKETDAGEGPGPALSVGVAPIHQKVDEWPCCGASKGWALAFWAPWGYGVFSHQEKKVKEIQPNHRVQVGDVIEVNLSENGEMSFILNGKDLGPFPYLLEWNETLYPIVFSYGRASVELERDHVVNIKPAKR